MYGKTREEETAGMYPAESAKFHLRKIEGKWKIVGMEQTRTRIARRMRPLFE